MDRIARALCLLVTASFLHGAEAPSKLVVLSYNIHHGAGIDERLDLERIAAVIRSVSPDVVAVQEVDRKATRTGGVDQAEELGRLTGMKAVFGKGIDFQGGEYGNTVLTRLPVLSSTVHPLPGEEPRSLIELRLKAGKLEFLFFATHLDATRAETHRTAAATRILEIAAARGETPAILAGDLNAVRESETMKMLASAWRAAGGERELPTIPVETPRRQIDWILFRPADRWRDIDVRVLDEKVASDHRPIVAVLELAQGKRNPEPDTASARSMRSLRNARRTVNPSLPSSSSSSFSEE